MKVASLKVIHARNPSFLGTQYTKIKSARKICTRTTKTNKLSVMKDIITYIYENKIDNYADFLMVCIQHSDDWFDVATNYNTLAINKMIDGMWLKKKNELR